MRNIHIVREGVIIILIASTIIGAGLWRHREHTVSTNCGSELVSCPIPLGEDLRDLILSESPRGWKWRTHELTSVIKSFKANKEIPRRVCILFRFLKEEFKSYSREIREDHAYSITKLKRNVRAREILLNSKFSGVPLKRDSSLRSLELSAQCEKVKSEIELDLFVLPLCDECKEFFLHTFLPTARELTKSCHTLKVRVTPFFHLKHPRLDTRSKFEFKMMREWFNRHDRMTLEQVRSWYSIGSRDYDQKSKFMSDLVSSDEVSLETIRREFKRFTGSHSAPILFVNQTYWPLDKYSFNVNHLSGLLSIDYGCEDE